MIGVPNTQGQKYWVGIVQWAPETSVSEEIADIFRNYNIDMSLIYMSLTNELMSILIQSYSRPIVKWLLW